MVDKNSVVHPTAGGQTRCGAGFTPADGGEAATAVGNRTPLAGIKPAPQGEGSRSVRQYARSVWGRVYPGRRGGGRNRSREPDAAGRHKAGPTGGRLTPGAAMSAWGIEPRKPAGLLSRQPKRRSPAQWPGFLVTRRGRVL